VVALAVGPFCAFGRRLLADLEHGFLNEAADCLKFALANKSSGTIVQRTRPMMCFMEWCRKRNLACFPIDESVVFAHCMDFEKRRAPASKVSQFVSALGFCIGVLGIDGAEAAVNSTRVRGIAYSTFLEKAPTKCKRALSVAQVELLENKVLNGELDAESLYLRYCSGTFLLMMYGRLRFSDMAKFQDLVFDQQYVEGSISQNKTSKTKEKATALLPVLVPVNGLVYQWCSTWRNLRRQLHLRDPPDQSLLPAFIGGKCTIRSCSNQEANMVLRQLLAGTVDASELGAFGTHSLKATPLSWCAKWGVSPDHRRVLGYHMDPGTSAMFMYGRDNVIGAVRVLEKVIDHVRKRDLVPDEVRSKMFKEKIAGPAVADPSTEYPGTEDPAADEDPVEDLDSSENETSGDDTSDEDEKDCNKQMEIAAANLGFHQLALVQGQMAKGTVLVQNRDSRIIHYKIEDDDDLLCGRREKSVHVSVAAGREATLLQTGRMCKDCLQKAERA
jgi:hypothetical protein